MNCRSFAPLDVQLLSGGLDRLEIGDAEIAQAEFQRMPVNRLRGVVALVSPCPSSDPFMP